ncbi:MAG: selenocysteine-specific translation elongation factor [Gammaproteobacteria bacterium]
MIIGTAGHIDHGKTALVKALTGIDADRLPEEKARGITIDLGYAYAPQADGSVLGFVDVPGHERLIHTMLAGALGIDFVLLVVAADDGVMPQTREHVEILDLLGLGQGAVALTKIDLVDEARIAEVSGQIVALLQGTGLADAPLFPVSARSGAGVAALGQHLAGARPGPQREAQRRNFRLAVDRSFTLKGVGVVVTGTAVAGSVAVNDTLTVSPRGLRVRVRGLHAQNQFAQQGHAGQRLALNVTGEGLEKTDIARGDWLVADILHAPTDRLDIALRVVAGGDRPMQHWTPVHVHLGAADITGRIALLSDNALTAGEQGLAQLVLDRPTQANRGDRVVLRDQSAQRTLAGGVVLDPFPPARKRRAPGRLALLAALRTTDAREALAVVIEQAEQGANLAQIARAWNEPEDTLRCCLPRSARPIETPDGVVVFAETRWQALRERALTALAEFHRQTPDELGPDRDRWRRLAFPALARSLFADLLDELVAAGAVSKHGAWVHLPEHRVVLSAAEQKLRARIMPLLDETPFDPPWVRDLATRTQIDEKSMRLFMQRLARMGEVYPVVRDLFYSQCAVEELARRALDLGGTAGMVRAAEFRDALGIGRKRAIQVLEFFDRIGFTRRIKGKDKDAHWLRPDSALAQTVGGVRREPAQSA